MAAAPRDFLYAISSCLRQYASISGRARQAEFWYWQLFCWVMTASYVTLSLILNDYYEDTLTSLSSLMSLTTFLPDLSVTIRRWKDTNLRINWWLPYAYCSGFLAIDSAFWLIFKSNLYDPLLHWIDNIAIDSFSASILKLGFLLIFPVTMLTCTFVIGLKKSLPRELTHINPASGHTKLSNLPTKKAVKEAIYERYGAIALAITTAIAVPLWAVGAFENYKGTSPFRIIFLIYLISLLISMLLDAVNKALIAKLAIHSPDAEPKVEG